MASYEQVLEYVTTPSTTEPTTLISAFSDSRIVSTFIVSNVGSSSANVSMAIYDGSDNKLVSILSNYSIGIGKSQTLNVNSLNLPATYKVMVESDSEDVNFCASGVKVTATYTGDAEDVIEEYTEAAKAVIDQAVIDAEAQIDAYAEGYEDTITNFASTTLQPYADDAEASASAASDSEANAATSEANASASASSASTSATEAADSATEATDIVTALQEDSSFTLTGDATGTGTMDASYQVSIAVDVNSADNATTADALSSAITVELDGDVTGSASTDGSSDVTITTTLDASAIGSLAVPYPDLHIPFNDGLRIESGYGTNDQIDVSAAQDGSVMVDLPSKSTDFTRSTGCYYINKSGLIDYADVDEPAITSDGVLLHGATSFSVSNSNDFTTYSDNGLTVTQSATQLSPFSYSTAYAYELVESSATEAHRVFTTYSATSGDKICLDFIFKPEDGFTVVSALINRSTDGAAFIYYDFESDTINTSANVDSYKVTNLSDGFIMFSFITTAESDYSSVNAFAGIHPTGTSTSSYAGSGSLSGHAAYFNVSNKGNPNDLISINSGSSSTITATTCTVPVENNMPAAGESFTIEFTCDVPTTRSHVFGLDNNTVDFSIWRFTSGGGLIFRFSDGNNTVSPTINLATSTGAKTYRCSYNSDSQIISIFAGSTLVSETDASGLDMNLCPIYNTDRLITIGKSNTSYLNSNIKGLKIYHSSLTEDQVKSMWSA
jgi:hypothetical protein